MLLQSLCLQKLLNWYHGIEEIISNQKDNFWICRYCKVLLQACWTCVLFRMLCMYDCLLFCDDERRLQWIFDLIFCDAFLSLNICSYLSVGTLYGKSVSSNMLTCVRWQCSFAKANYFVIALVSFGRFVVCMVKRCFVCYRASCCAYFVVDDVEFYLYSIKLLYL